MEADLASKNQFSSSFTSVTVAVLQNSSQNHVPTELIFDEQPGTTTNITEKNLPISNLHQNVTGDTFLPRLEKIEMIDAATNESPMNSAPRSALDKNMPPLREVHPVWGPNLSPLTQPSLQSSEKRRIEKMVSTSEAEFEETEAGVHLSVPVAPASRTIYLNYEDGYDSNNEKGPFIVIPYLN